MAGQIVVGNRTKFRYTVVDQDGTAVDVSSATTKTIYLRSPRGGRHAFAASFTTDGSDGVVECTATQPAPAGVWKASVYLAGVAGFSGYSEVDVYPVLDSV